jgi:calcium/calmodulin-dependent protein kinase (CaM kinase) II
MTDEPTPSAPMADRDREILAINQAMLESVLRGDWQAYEATCSHDVSCFEAETNGVLVEGLPFHRFYFGDGAASAEPGELASAQVTMARPHLRWLSDDLAVLSYTRLVQRQANGVFTTSSCCETRIWQRRDAHWLQVHVHRS